jgi:hypothetical protein
MSGECDKCGEHCLDYKCGLPKCQNQKNSWVNVKDKLPENYQYVLVYALTKGTGEPCPISIARSFNGKWEMLNYAEEENAVACGDLTWFMSDEEITHWMELPIPPEGKWKNY